MRAAFIVVGVSAGVLLACAPPQSSGVSKPKCEGSIVIVQEDVSPFPCDMNPPQRLDLEMNPDSGAEARCNHFGGRWNPRDSEGGEDICEGVDY